MSPDASWSLTPGPIVLVTFAAGLYVYRWLQMREAHSAWRGLSFLTGCVCLLAALASPIDTLGEQLMTMHMIQHVLLLDIAPILLILGFTRVFLRPVTRRFLIVERRAGFFATPVFAVLLYVGSMWIWHMPALYGAAVENALVHAFEHLLMSVAGGLYWWHVFSPIRSRHRLTGIGPIAYMGSTRIMLGLLGVVLTFAPHSFYGVYEVQPNFWGLSPKDDQAVAGLIMATEQSIVMGVAFVWLFVKALGESEVDDQRAERYAAG